MRTHCRLAFVLWLVAAVHTPLWAQSAAPPSDKTAASIDACVRKCMDTQQIPGLSIAIAADDQLVFSQGFGLADVENQVKATSDTVYRTASIAKTLTAVAVLKLAEDGKIDLDRPVDEYFTTFPKKKWPITARQLLGHMAGVRHYEGSAEPLNTKHYSDIASALHTFDADPLLFKPGTEFHYSSFGYNLLGAILEQASGKDYATYVHEAVCEPAQMQDTRTDNHFDVIPRRAHGYIRLSEEQEEKLPDAIAKELRSGTIYNAPLHDTSVKIPGGGMVSTSPDLVRFATAINRGKLLRAETRKAMWEPQHTLAGEPSEYGLGWRIMQHDGAKVVGHSGGQSGVSTYFLLCPEKHTAAAVMCNLQGAKLQPLCLELLDAASKVSAEDKR
jgi:CubicO group peptidase (beta-lactamase class C family)